ncbi:hypothetical protein [Botrimarina mediterranea]|uniref:Uncharacterized protein n=1 Tax=Botrimarina mediterranea TaxID=2528022 RepID=A0A518KD14_9BACT|nr:hypothetical protein [Botrimarina mediterranea]QDV75686.1 hypothetical protein Spa11_39060 [Botrimarina mediterranea]QDV80322.1 hypothetical protein K2D_39480 [Planctomycetes bacterium K2D]
MRTNVCFRYPAPFVPVPDNELLLSTDGAIWFVDLLRKVPNLQINEELCQEDWGVVVFVNRNSARYWVGIGRLQDQNEGDWLAFFNPSPLSWLPWRRRHCRRELGNLIEAMHDVLQEDASVSQIVWYEEKEMRTPNPKGFATPT